MPGELLLKALEKTWHALTPLNLPMAVMGGIAVSIYDHARSTRDVDILIQMESRDTDQVMDVLFQAGIKPRRMPPLLHLDQQWILFLYYQPPGAFYEVKIDLLYADNEYQKQALARRELVPLPHTGTQVYILSCEDLIIHKLQAGRIIDRADCAALLRGNRATMDMTYLKTWLDQFELKSAWQEIWDEAFPGEASPI